ncbi:MAG: sulfatase [Planctomycetes bacterium]|nr:sulfatase [Planctomycetota bacterium]
MKRFLVVACACWAIGLGVAETQEPASKSAAETRMNVLFIAIDDLRPELGCYGVPYIKTPAMDRLAASGTLFERAYCQQSVCNPSRASLLSGCRPATTKVVVNNVNLLTAMPNVVTLPRLFKDQGYHTVSIGKIFHIEEKVTDDAQAWSEPSFMHKPGIKSWYTPESLDLIRQRPAEMKTASKLADNKAARRGPPFEAADLPDSAYNDHALAERAVQALEHVKGKPFFLAVGFSKPHLPFCCPQKYFDLYPLDTIELPQNRALPAGVPAVAGHDWYELRTYASVPPRGPISDEMARRLIQGYRACTSFVDAQIGLVLDELDRQGLRDSTIVVLWGDHGYHLGEHDIWTKMTNFELATRVPLIVRVPGRPAGQRARGIVELLDLYPTLAELCALPAPPQLEGKSFASLLNDASLPGKKVALSEYTRPKQARGVSVRSDKFRYTQWHDLKGKLLGSELYDEVADPGENTNLIDNPKYADEAARLALELDENHPFPGSDFGGTK